jgi:hypothetical protein
MDRRITNMAENVSPHAPSAGCQHARAGRSILLIATGRPHPLGVSFYRHDDRLP